MAFPNHNTHFCVKNLNGTSGPRYVSSQSKSESSWLKVLLSAKNERKGYYVVYSLFVSLMVFQVWRTHTNSTRATCCVRGCSRDDLVGGHVIKTDSRSSNEWWLAPICKGHNHYSNTDGMWIDQRVQLVKLRV